MASDLDASVMESEPTSRGLTEAEVADRRARGLGNSAPPPTTRTYEQILRENVFTFINIVLLCLGIALALLGRFGDALVSTTIISLNIIVSVVQEIRAKRTLDRIALLTWPTATVLRDGQTWQVAPEDLVMDDVLVVGPGDQIVLDGRVLDGRMQVDESNLTGESNLIAKQAGDPVYSGSFCASGGGRCLAEKVGADSLSNQITAGARAFRRVLTPLQREINLVIQLVLLIVVYVEVLLVLNSWLRQLRLGDAIAEATLVAGLVPNGLFLSISIAYALGAVRLIRFGALVQQSNSIESLSHVDVLCLDKTGTLTANRLALESVHPLAGDEASLRRTLGVIAASATTSTKTSEAIAVACPGERRPLAAEIPFSSARKWSAVAFASDEPCGVFALGAVEFLRPYLAADEWPAIAEQAERLTDRGLRVLLVATAPDPATSLHDEGDDSRLPHGMTPLGLLSFSDELRPEAKATLVSFIESGVMPKIISGDHPETVASLARQAGLGADARLVSGLDLEEMDDAQFATAAVQTTIFGRITPQQKERLVRALRERGHYVAMIGDGVNDVLSLKQANLGIAMQSGSQATRGVADIILTNDSFAALAPAVREGQRILNGMEDILKLYLTRITTVGLVILSSMVIGHFPLELRQGSAIALLSVGIPTIVLAAIARPGPTARSRLVQRLFHFVAPPMLVGSLIAVLLFYLVLGLLALQTTGFGEPTTPEQAQAAIMAALPLARTALAWFLVITGLFLVIFVEPPTRWWVGADDLSGDWRPTWLALILMAFFFLLNALPGGRAFFALESLGLLEILVVGAAVGLWVLTLRWLWRHQALARFLGLRQAGGG